MDCGKKYPYRLMTWDHVRGEKHFNIGEGIRGRSEEEILREISNCDLVCRACHDDRERRRGKMGKISLDKPSS